MANNNANILVTGANGFIGKHLIHALKAKGYTNITEMDTDTDYDSFEKGCANCDFVFHFAGIMRPKDQKDFKSGNLDFTIELINNLQKSANYCPILFTSSTQAELDNDYGRSKKSAEEQLEKYAKSNGTKVFIFRLTNVFGEGGKPNFNSVIATFCHNIANNLPIQINNRETEMTLVYVGDVVKAFINVLDDKADYVNGFAKIPIEHKMKLGDIADLINSFKEGNCPGLEKDSFEKKLHSTYLSFLPDKM